MKGSYTTQEILQTCSLRKGLSMSYKAHLALEDIKTLQSLDFYGNISCDVLLKHSFSVEYVSMLHLL